MTISVDEFSKMKSSNRTISHQTCRQIRLQLGDEIIQSRFHLWAVGDASRWKLAVRAVDRSSAVHSDELVAGVTQ